MFGYTRFLFESLALSEAVRSLPYYNVSLDTFRKIDSNVDNIIDPNENLEGYKKLKQNSSDIEIKKESFIQRVIKRYGLNSTVATSMYDQHDKDKNGVLNETEYKLMYKDFDADGNNRLTIDEFIIADNKMLNAAGAPVPTE